MNLTSIIPPRVPFTDPRTGLIAREWYLFLLNLFTLTGSGNNDTSLTDLAVAVAPQVTDAAQIGQQAQLASVMARYDAALNYLDPTSFGAPRYEPPVDQTYFVATTDDTPTTLATVNIPASTTLFLEVTVVARRTGGSAGTANDGAGYVVCACYKNEAGTATEIGETAIFTAESQAGWDCVVTGSGANALVQITGAIDNNVNWLAKVRTLKVS